MPATPAPALSPSVIDFLSTLGFVPGVRDPVGGDPIFERKHWASPSAKRDKFPFFAVIGSSAVQLYYGASEKFVCSFADFFDYAGTGREELKSLFGKSRFQATPPAQLPDSTSPAARTLYLALSSSRARLRSLPDSRGRLVFNLLPVDDVRVSVAVNMKTGLWEMHDDTCVESCKGSGDSNVFRETLSWAQLGGCPNRVPRK